MMQQREEKQLEASVESLISRVAHVKNALHSFVYKLENEYDRLTWPSVLDNFALLSGQLNTINKLLRNEKTPSFRNQVIIPLLLCPDRDEDLAKQIQTLNKLCSNLLEKLNNPRDDKDMEAAALRQNKPSFNPADTSALVGAVAFGKGLSKCRPPGPVAPSHAGQGPMISGGPTLQQVTIGGGSGQQSGIAGPVVPQQQGQPGKMPSSIKTNIKSASASMHPYTR
ncbi:mediator of RNA polymerase II transcription subunit 8 isoform X2 [Thalassophryne amazonica]|uniref:mediator of RNA polymerase II transcription subunit 8 isoform X2 n=1 Tax=Thalassophryne amazonica TaxID=390379 RepID=UPI00147245F9|nr:mediator of RNA polymerase II transcription subunit 8 isoform X2 [Thalassophryne amazonica]